MKRKFILVFMVVFIITVLGFSYLKFNKISINKNHINCSNIYYTLTLPDNWEYKVVDNYDTDLYLNGNKVGYVNINPNCEYCATISSIITNWFGMNAYIKGDIQEKKMGEIKRIKVTIAFEQSAAEQIKGITPEAEQLHYIYTNYKDLMIDLFLDSKHIDRYEIEEISNSLIVK